MKKIEHSYEYEDPDVNIYGQVGAFSQPIKVPILSWCNEPELSAMKQAMNLANLPFTFRHVALMSDTHCGFGMPIGGVLACKNIIIPNAVGKDIGCGMLSVRTSLTEIDTETVKKIMGDMRKLIPVGLGKGHSEMQDESLMPTIGDGDVIVSKHYDSARKQIGSLGTNNHFLEIQKGGDGLIYFMIHSGSRKLGGKVAEHYDKIAKTLNERWHSVVPEKHDLAFLPIETKEAKSYLSEMKYCLDFARANRQLMAIRTREAFSNHVSCGFEAEINIHHNYVSIENHMGQNVWVHRKGATSARLGEIGLIPGAPGTASYIVKGKGNIESFQSCSHGAGRTMSRKKAIKELDLEKEQKILDDQGIVHSIRNADDLDEATSSYKDITVVMESQEDLVNIVTELKTLGTIKGPKKRRNKGRRN